MNNRSLKILSLGFLMSILLAISAFPTGDSYPTGITDDNLVKNGCTCHSTGPMDSNVIINLTNLPEIYNSSKVYTLTLKISGGPDALTDGNQGGFFIQTNYGTLESIDNNTWVPEGETHLTHNEEGNNYREWSFNWIAPESDSKIVEFTVYGNSVNGADGNIGDYWNKGEFSSLA